MRAGASNALVAGEERHRLAPDENVVDDGIVGGAVRPPQERLAVFHEDAQIAGAALGSQLHLQTIKEETFPGDLHHGRIDFHHVQRNARMLQQQLLGIGEPSAAEHEHAVYDQRIRRLGKRRLEEVVEGSQVRKGARRPTLVQIGRRLQHPAHVQHAHKRSVLRRHRIHRRLPEPRRKHLALPRAPGDPVPPIRQHHRPFPSLQLRPRPNLIALCATVSHRNRRVSFSCLPDRAAIATVERRMRSSATRRALCWPSPSTPYQGSRVP